MLENAYFSDKSILIAQYSRDIPTYVNISYWNWYSGGLVNTFWGGKGMVKPFFGNKWQFKMPKILKIA